MRTNASPRLTLVRGGGGTEESGSALEIFGPKRAGLITTQPTSKEVQLSESLNDLEREVSTLESRFYEACVTLNIVISDLVRLGLIGSSIDTTENKITD